MTPSPFRSSGALVVALVAGACSGRGAPTSATVIGPPAETAPIPVPPGGQIVPGTTIQGVISPGAGECSFWVLGESWGGLCSSYMIAVPTSGLLTIELRSADALAVFLKMADGRQVDVACCGTASIVRIPVEAGTSYRLEVVYSGRPVGYPDIPPAPYTLATRFEAPSTSLKGTAQIIVFGDADRTQRLPAARVEIVSGPAAGTIAATNPGSDIHNLSLPLGYVDIRAAADGFLPRVERILVGSSVPIEIALTRQQTLTGARHQVAGFAKSGHTAFVGVRVEVVGGILDGIFTLTDDLMGMYVLKNVPPGPLRLRATGQGFNGQILDVMVPSSVATDFVRP